MFTGVIEAVADVVSTKEDDDMLLLTLTRPNEWSLHKGQSIAVNGVCLTVTVFDKSTFTVEIMPETKKRSIFGVSIPKSVNVERAMSTQTLFEGHIVQGHVDELGTVINIDESPQWRTIHISYSPSKAGLLVKKGSVAIDGISLTIVSVSDDSFSVALIPHTLEHTTLGAKKVGDYVNIEYDILGKFVEKQLKLHN